MEKLYFRLHPSKWQFKGDEEQIFRLLKLANGEYLLSWETEHDIYELFLGKEEVELNISNSYWIITDENGEFL